jgi:hypothetical protein
MLCPYGSMVFCWISPYRNGEPFKLNFNASWVLEHCGCANTVHSWHMSPLRNHLIQATRLVNLVVSSSESPCGGIFHVVGL